MTSVKNCDKAIEPAAREHIVIMSMFVISKPPIEIMVRSSIRAICLKETCIGVVTRKSSPRKIRKLRVMFSFLLGFEADKSLHQ